MQIYHKPGSKERLFEMMKGVAGMKPKLNEDYDSPKEKDEEYLNKSVGTNPTDISKYDGDLNYPVEKDLRVNSDMIHQEPVDECNTPMSEGIPSDADHDYRYGGPTDINGKPIKKDTTPERPGAKQPKGPDGKVTYVKPIQEFDAVGEVPATPERPGAKQPQPANGSVTFVKPEPTHGDSFGQTPSNSRLGAEYADLVKQFGQDRVNLLFPSGQKGFEDSRTRGNYSIDAIKQNLSR